LTFSTRRVSSCDHLVCDIVRTVQAHISLALNEISKKKLSEGKPFFLLRYSATVTQNGHKINVKLIWYSARGARHWKLFCNQNNPFYTKGFHCSWRRRLVSL